VVSTAQVKKPEDEADFTSLIDKLGE
jgi:hypothetical protein